MIRASDLSNPALWTARPAGTAPRAGARDAANWFEDATAGSGPRISGDVAPSARGLSVEQHASLVLAHLRGEDTV
jgi:hypothetical protein